MRHHALRPLRPLVALAALATLLLAAAPAAAQYIVFPRIGLSVEPDRYERTIEVTGREPFQLHAICVGPEDGEPLATGIAELKWGILEACCGGAAQVLDVQFDPVCQSEGNLYDIVTSTPAATACLQQDMIHLATVTLQMAENVPEGLYYVVAGPRYPGLDCEGENVILSDLTVDVIYTHAEGQTPTEATSWGDVKALYR